VKFEDVEEETNLEEGLKILAQAAGSSSSANDFEDG